jgi:HPt (histidine-containing phosphotransfer) domain-containing protein
MLNKFVRDKQPPEVIEAARQEKNNAAELTQAARAASSNIQTEQRFKNKEITGLDIVRGIEQYEGDEETYLRVLRSYAEAVHSRLSTIETFSADTLADYERAVHSIKGASYGIFAEQVGKDAESLEKAAKNGNLDYISEYNGAFFENTLKFVTELNNVITAIDAENPKLPKDTPDAEVLSKLMAACKTYDMDGADAAMEEIEKYRYTSDNGLANWLRESMDRMAFPQIVDKLSDLNG